MKPFGAPLIARSLMGAASLVMISAPSYAALTASDLRCEYKTDPLAIESAHPRLFWKVASAERGDKQTAYHIQVATSRAALTQGKADLWDTGQVASSETVQVPYGGKALSSNQQVFWRVRSWDAKGKPSAWSAPATWTMGLLQPSDWKAKWIGRANESDVQPIPIEGAKWIWGGPAGDAPVETRYFRTTLNLPADAKLTNARFAITADDNYVITINGKELKPGPTDMDSWRSYQVYDIARELRAGANTIQVKVNNTKSSPAGLLARLVVETSAGEQIIATDEKWENATQPNGTFVASRVVTNYGGAPWNQVTFGNKIERTPPPYFRKEFTAQKPVKRAVLYATALGSYDISLNGKQVNNDVLSPGWTDFNKRAHYLAYDITSQVKQGKNAIGAILGDGWYGSYIAFTGRHHIYGGETKLCLQMHLDYADGTSEVIGTDKSWAMAEGDIKAADLLMGCIRDTRAEMPGWTTVGFNASAWKPAAEQSTPKLIIDTQPNEPIREIATVPAFRRMSPKPGVYIYDMGQNMVGWVRLKIKGQPGQKIQLRHAERLNPDGTMYLTNLRAAKATDTFILNGRQQVIEPQFTFHGFQYVEITGTDTPPAVEAVTGIVLHSDLKSTLAFESDNPLLNRLVKNIDWGFRGNAVDVPTDCPQRDERAGWTGDAQVFAKTAMFHRDAGAFYTKWLYDMEDGQRADGAYPDVAPSIIGAGNAAWEDAGVICTYRLYEMYGDTEVIRTHWNSLTKYMEHLNKVAPDGIRPDGAFGDWLLLDGPQHSTVFGTAYYYQCANLMAQMAAAIGKTDEAATYKAVADRVKAKFIETFVKPDGTVQDKGVESQTFYALALDWDLLPPSARAGAAAKLKGKLAQRGNHLATGFIGTPALLPALANSGDAKTANTLLLTDTYPSWLYQVKLGATTMWERWDGWTPEKGFQDPGMNSFNHYWLGCVGEYMYTDLAGIDTVSPGWKEISIRPQTDTALNKVSCSYDSIRGKVTSSWSKKSDGTLSLAVTVPANVSATVYVPATDAAKVMEGGKPAANANGVSFVRQDKNAAVYSVGSGSYTFTVKP